MPKLAVCIMIAGTRGDVQPFIALGLKMKVRRHGLSRSVVDLIDDGMASTYARRCLRAASLSAGVMRLEHEHRLLQGWRPRLPLAVTLQAVTACEHVETTRGMTLSSAVFA